MTEDMRILLVGILGGGSFGLLLIPLLPFNQCWSWSAYRDFWRRVFEP